MHKKEVYSNNTRQLTLKTKIECKYLKTYFSESEVNEQLDPEIFRTHN